MANVLKYSTTTVANTIKKGNVVFGVNKIDYGPTASTGFLAGIDPPSSGYTIYTFPGSGTTPTAVAPSNDSQLISQATSFGGKNISTASDALRYFASGSPITVAINKTFPNVVTSGLTYLFDGGFCASYPTAGTVWYDLSGNGFDGSLVNGPTYSAGTLNFDGVDDYMTIPNGITLSGANTMLFTIYGNYQNYYLGVFERSSAKGAGLSTVIPRNGWNQVGYIWDGSASKFVINGTTYNANTGAGFPYDNALFRPLFWAGNFSYFGSNSSPNLSFHLQNTSGGITGFLWSGFTYKAFNITATAGNRRYFSGNTANIAIYNRALTTDEVIQNYEAFMNPYGTLQVQYLVVAGGGGGGSSKGGGGGAGGLLTGSTLSLTTSTTYTVTVGAGGNVNANGSNSIFNTATSIGGGRGGYLYTTTAGTGGSGGGAGGAHSTIGQGYSGGTPTVGQGFKGGGNYDGVTILANSGGGGGGGASMAGYNALELSGGTGGDGLYISEYTSLGGSPSGWFAGGAGGGAPYNANRGLGSNGGGGRGAQNSTAAGQVATAGTINTGGGGGGAAIGGAGGDNSGRAGGSGIVILRIPDVFTANFSSGVTATMSRTGGYKYYKVTATSTTSETVYFS